MKSVRRTFRQTNHASPEEMFPLLCPVREREWAVGWECRLVHSLSGVAELGAVFTTSRAGEADTTWIITLHDAAAGQVEFATFTPENRVGRIEIQLSRKSENESWVDIAYNYVALSAAGEESVQRFTEEYFAGMMRDWQEEINHFLLHREMLRR